MITVQDKVQGRLCCTGAFLCDVGDLIGSIDLQVAIVRAYARGAD